MFLKSFLLISIAILAISGLPVENEVVDFSEKGIVEDIEEILHRIHELLKEIIAVEKEHIKKFLEDLIKLAKDALAEAQAALEKELEEIYEEFEKLHEALVGAHEDAKECFKENKDRLKELHNKAKADLHECVDARVAEAKEIYENAIKTMYESSLVFAQLVTEYEECKTNACKVGVVKKVVEEGASLSVKIADIVKEAKAFMQAAVPEIRECLNGKIKELRAEAKEIFQDIGKCIKDKNENA